MKAYTITALMFAFGGAVSAQTPTTTKNFVMETTVKVTGKTDTSHLAGLPVAQANRTVNYFDGLGRPMQTVQWKASPGEKDIVQVVEYDQFGRQLKQYLPYAEQTSNNASFKTAGIANQASYYTSGSWDANIVKTPYPFNLQVPELSPLNRLMEQGAAGAAWQPYNAGIATSGHTVRTAYTINSTNEVRRWVAGSSGASTSTYYAAGKLTKTITRSENWNPDSLKAGTIAEFKDMEGRLILKRMWKYQGDSLDTWYVYDDYNELRYVIPPAVTATTFTEADAVFDQFIYGYRYDGRKRLVEKKIPGKGWEYLVYNKLDQVIFTQDAVQRAANQWLFTKYDVQGRVIMTGIYSDIATRATLQSNLNGLSLPLWEAKSTVTTNKYTNDAYPNVAISATHLINYYDDYNIQGYGSNYHASVTVSGRTTGKLTGTRVNVLGSSTMMLSAMYYDEEGRPVETIADNHIGGRDRTVNTYNFAGELTSSTRTHIVAVGSPTTIVNTYTYDHMGRKLTTGSNIDSQGNVVLNKFVYNEIGQMKQKHLHSTDGGSTFLQNTKFAYNARGWFKHSTSAQLNIKLAYDTLSAPNYNGNITTQEWGTSFGNKFLYSYDKLNRLTNSTSTGIVMNEVITYDKMGNINTLGRDGGTPRLYVYTGNRLNWVEWVTLSYAYDANGNATTDGRTSVVHTYNHLNLPTTATKSGLSITYTYDATGKKLSKVSSTTGTTHYVAGIQYNGTTIDFIHTEEGIARRNSGTYTYEYNLTDHLGNVRYTFNKHPTTGILQKLQEDNYYAFGLRKSATAGSNEYLYNGKELEEELGQYDYGARFYDPIIGRWNVVDPLADMSRRWSPYTYGKDNPIKFVDPDGMFDQLYDQKGNDLGVDETGVNGRARIVTDEKEIEIAKGNKGKTFTDSKLLTSSISISKTALGECIAILNRTQASTAKDSKGGLHGESSIVMKNGTIIQGESGGLAYINDMNQLQSDETLPNLPAETTDSDVEVGIHSHVTGAFKQDNFIYSGDAKTPSDVDVKGSGRFATNITVGPLGKAVESNQKPGAIYQSENGIVIKQSGRGATLNMNAVNKIMKK